MNVFYNTIVFVRDIEISRHFYESIIGVKVEQAYDSIVFFENHFVIHDKQKIYKTVFDGKLQAETIERSDILIYFETDDVNRSYQHIVSLNVPIIHSIKKQEWGQQVFRFYDPDNHIVEIGEAMHLDYLKQQAI